MIRLRLLQRILIGTYPHVRQLGKQKCARSRVAPSWRILMFDNLFKPEHLLIILAIALLIFGPSKLPGLGKGLGEAFRGFKDGIKGSPDNDANKQQENTAAKSETVTPQVK